MQVISVEEIMTNSRIDTSDENEYIESIGEVAEETIINACNTTWDDVTAEYGYIPYGLKHACLLYADYLYTHRGATTNINVNVLPLGIPALISKYRKLV